MTRYRTKAKYVEAIQFNGRNGAECGLRWHTPRGGVQGWVQDYPRGRYAYIPPNAWIITDERIHRFWLHPDEFFREYEAAPERNEGASFISPT